MAPSKAIGANAALVMFSSSQWDFFASKEETVFRTLIKVT